MSITIPTFPTFPGLEFPVTRTNQLNTTRLMAQSGRRFQQPKWPYPIYQYTISIATLRLYGSFQEYQTFQGFWNSVMSTPSQLFTWVDPNDSTVTNQYFGTGDGVRTTFQAMRTMGGFIEPVTALLPNSDPPATIVDNGLVTSAVTTTVDNGAVTDPVGTIVDNGLVYLTKFMVNGVETNVTIFDGGVLKFNTPPANGTTLTWTGIFGWLCQFDEDTVELANFSSGSFSMDTLSFTTARPNA